MIRRKGASWEVRVYAGRDPVTGRERYVSRSFPAQAREKVPPRRVKDEEARLRTEVREGRHSGTDQTVGGMLDAWLARIGPDLSPWTVNGYRGIIDRNLKPQIGTVRLRALTTARIEALYDSLSVSGGRNGEGLDPQTIRHTHAVLRRALARAVRLGQIDRNPADGAVPPAVARQILTIPDTGTVDQLVAKCTDPDMRLLVLLAAATGARRGELCGLRWSDIDLDRQTLTIRRSVADPGGTVTVKEPKTHRVRVLAIGPGLCSALTERHERAGDIAAQFGTTLHPDAYILSEVPDGSEPLRPELASKRFSRLAKKAGVTCRLHDLRHHVATTLLANGVPVRDVADRLGHASPRMTLDVYSHATQGADRRAAEITDRQ